MTRAERDALKARIDKARRKVLGAPIAGSCKACGVDPLDDFGKPRYLEGCTTCTRTRDQRRRVEARRHVKTDGPRCTLDGCDRPNEARGLCRAHYRRLERTGSPGGAYIQPRKIKVPA